MVIIRGFRRVPVLETLSAKNIAGRVNIESGSASSDLKLLVMGRSQHKSTTLFFVDF